MERVVWEMCQGLLKKTQLKLVLQPSTAPGTSVIATNDGTRRRFNCIPSCIQKRSWLLVVCFFLCCSFMAFLNVFKWCARV